MAIIVLFRKDLRLIDNSALYYAAKLSDIIPIYIKKPNNNSAVELWLDKALKSLNESLNGNLNIYIADPLEILTELCQYNNITAIYANKCHESIELDKLIANFAHQKNIEFKVFDGNFLWNHNLIKKQDGGFYKIYTHFKNCCLTLPAPDIPLSEPKLIKFADNKIPGNYVFKSEKWHEKILNHWVISENGANERLHQFIANGLIEYKEKRNFPSYINNVSRLSPYLQCGQISVKMIYHQVKRHENLSKHDIDHYISELIWREFAYYLLTHFPELPNKNFNPKFDHFPWAYDQNAFDKWKKGITGCEIVDAGMRELWETGYMHNRVRMIVASFLVKNLMIDWRYGAKWFMNCLVDADIANNSAGWQWVAGSGSDAAPYYRIFNPELQVQKFDPDKIYIKSFIKETNYPDMIVDLSKSRLAALDAFNKIK